VSKITRCSNASDTFNQKYRLVSLCNSYSDVKLKAGCKVGGIEAARLAIGLETGTGEADLFHPDASGFNQTNVYGTDERTVESHVRKNRSKSVADALVVAMNPAKAERAKGSNRLVI